MHTGLQSSKRFKNSQALTKVKPASVAVMIRILIDKPGMAFFYCDYKDAATQEPANIFGSLVKQFVFSSEAAFRLAESFYDAHSRSSSGHQSVNTESLIESLHNITELLHSTTIVIDGLDEISANRFDALDLIKQIYHGRANTRVLFASRPERDIEQCLSDFDSISIAARSSDLELYVASEIEKRSRRRELNIRDMDLKDLIMKRLVHGADGM